MSDSAQVKPRVTFALYSPFEVRHGGRELVKTSRENWKSSAWDDSSIKNAIVLGRFLWYGMGNFTPSVTKGTGSPQKEMHECVRIRKRHYEGNYGTPPCQLCGKRKFRESKADSSDSSPSRK